MKRIASLILILVLTLALCVPASAGYEYELLYDGTELLDETTCENMGFDTLPDLTKEYQVEFRVDVIKNPGDLSISEYAAEFYEKYEYGYADDGSQDGVLLMLYLTENGNDLVFHDYTVCCGGENKAALQNAADELQADLAQYLNETSWRGDLTQDNAAFSGAMDLYAAWAVEWFSKTDDTTDDQQPVTPVVPTEEPDEIQEPAGLQPFPDALSGAADLYVVDAAGILTKEQCAALQKEAKRLSETYDCPTYIITVDDFTKYSDRSIETTAKTIYETYDLGYREDKSGALLLLSMADRDYWMLAHGYGNTVYTDYASDWIWKKAADNFKDDDWAGGFTDYLSASEKALQMAADGHPLVYSNSTLAHVAGVPISCVLALIVAAIVLSVLKAQMRSVQEESTAEQYSSGVNITNRDDTYTHATTTRRKIERDDSDRGGGHSFSGTTVGSDGYSGHGGKF